MYTYDFNDTMTVNNVQSELLRSLSMECWVLNKPYEFLLKKQLEIVKESEGYIFVNPLDILVRIIKT